MHIVLSKLKTWGIGKKIFGYVKSFLTNRKFFTKTNNIFSSAYPLHNGIPQGSPLSVVLFIIAFDDISTILNKYTLLDSCFYADDISILTKVNNVNECKNLLSNAINDILVWSNASGAKLSLNKCKLLHVCRKHQCPELILSIHNVQIENVKNLNILGLTFDNRYKWIQHCLDLKKSLAARLNIIKYLGSKKSHLHINTISSITKMLVLSKIDYGIYIYGNCPKSTLKIIKPIYHQAARRSINAFPTTPIKNIIAEAGLPTLEQRSEEISLKLVAKLFFSTNSIIDKDIHQSIGHKHKKRIPSAISIILDNAEQMDVPIKRTCSTPPCSPPWNIKSDSFIMTLAQYRKTNTSNVLYCSLFSYVSSDLKNKGWKFIFTDGSKSPDNTSFAVTREDGYILSIGTLPELSSIFTAEAFAILQATKTTTHRRGKFVICSDSISVLRAISNPNNNSPLISEIRNKISMMPNKLKLMWTPGHVNIRGNEEADNAASSAKEAPVYKSNIFTNQDLKTNINKF